MSEPAGPPGGTYEGEGWDHVAWRVEDPAGDWIVKQVKDDTDGDGPASVAREAAVMGFVAARVGRWVAAEATAAGNRLTYRRVPGVALDDLIDAGRISPAVVRARAADLGAFVAQLARLDPRDADLAVPDDDHGFAEWFAGWDDHVAVVRPLLDAASVRLIERFRAAPPPPDLPPERRVFTHNDLGAEHVLVDPETLTISGVIDWTDAAWSDPAAEVGRLVRDLGASALGPVLDALDGVGGAPGAVADRTWSFARLLAVEDLAYAVTTRPDLVERERRMVARVFTEAG